MQNYHIGVEVKTLLCVIVRRIPGICGWSPKEACSAAATHTMCTLCKKPLSMVGELDPPDTVENASMLLCSWHPRWLEVVHEQLKIQLCIINIISKHS